MNLSALEAALTGESVPIDKTVDVIQVEGDPSQTPLGDRHNMCFSATLVSQGSGLGLVVATGDNTEIGTINALVSKVEKKKTNVLEQIDTVSKYLAFFIAITALATWFVAFFITDESGIDALTTALVCRCHDPKRLGSHCDHDLRLGCQEHVEAERHYPCSSCR